MGEPGAGETRWPEIGALFAAGVSASLQFGKVAPAMLPIAGELGIGLSGAAGLISVFTLVAAVAGLPAGLAAARAGMRRVLLAGLLLLGAAGLADAAASGPLLLYACRVVEGAAFLAVIVAAPTLVAARAAAADRPLAMAVWSSFMPAGIALGMLSAPLVEGFGWRTAWAALALLPPAAALLLGALLPRSAGTPEAADGRAPTPVGALFRARLPVLVAAAFACYAAVYSGVTGFLPARLVEGFGLPLGVAGSLGAASAVLNIAGNLMAGRLIRAGARPAVLVLGAGAALALLGAGVFLLPFSLPLTLSAALLGSGIGGMVPGSLFALAPRAVPDPALTGPAIGLLVQFNNIGLAVSPAAVAAAVRLGWGWAAVPLLAAGAALLLLAWPLRRVG